MFFLQPKDEEHHVCLPKSNYSNPSVIKPVSLNKKKNIDRNIMHIFYRLLLIFIVDLKIANQWIMSYNFVSSCRDITDESYVGNGH